MPRLTSGTVVITSHPCRVPGSDNPSLALDADDTLAQPPAHCATGASPPQAPTSSPCLHNPHYPHSSNKQAASPSPPPPSLYPSPTPQSPHLHHEPDPALQALVLRQPLHPLKVHLHPVPELDLDSGVQLAAHRVQQLAQALNVLSARRRLLLQASHTTSSESGQEAGGEGGKKQHLQCAPKSGPSPTTPIPCLHHHHWRAHPPPSPFAP